MKWTPVLILVLIGLVAGDGAWKRNQEYQYKLQAKTLVESLQSKDKWFGVISRARLSIRPQSDDLLIGQISQAEYANQDTAEVLDSDINDRYLDYTQWPLNKPFKIHLRDGAIKSISVDRSMTNQQINQLKLIVNQFHVDTNVQNVIEDEANVLPQDGSNNAFYKKMEPALTGNCETSYDISPLPDYLAQAYRALIPLIDSNDSTDSNEKVEFMQIVKTKNNNNCKERHGYIYNITDRSVNQNLDDLTQASRIIVSGSLKSYTIQSSVTTKKVVGSPALYEYVNVTLVSVEPNTQYQTLSYGLENMMDIENLVYSDVSLNNPNSDDHQNGERYYERLNPIRFNERQNENGDRYNERQNVNGDRYMERHNGDRYMERQNGNRFMNSQNDDRFMNRQNDDRYMNRQNDGSYKNRQNDDRYMNRQNDDRYMNRQNDGSYKNRQNDDRYMNRQNNDRYKNSQNEDQYNQRQNEDQYNQRQNEDRYNERQSEDRYKERQNGDRHNTRQNGDLNNERQYGDHYDTHQNGDLNKDRKYDDRHDTRQNGDRYNQRQNGDRYEEHKNVADQASQNIDYQARQNPRILSMGIKSYQNGDRSDKWSGCSTWFPAADAICLSNFGPEWKSVQTTTCGFLGLGKKALCRYEYPGCEATNCYSVIIKRSELCERSFGSRLPVTKGGWENCAPGFYRSRCCPA